MLHMYIHTFESFEYYTMLHLLYTCIVLLYNIVITIVKYLVHYSVVIWDIAAKEAICGSQAAMQSAGPVYALAFCRCSDDLLVTGGE